MLTNRFASDEIQDKLPHRYTFVCFSSFEERCTTVVKSLDSKAIDTAYILSSMGLSSNVKHNEYLSEMKASLSKNIIERVIDLTKPFSIANELTKVIKEIINEGEVQNEKQALVIDITTFNHEALLMLLRLLHINIGSFDCVKCLYNGASSYSGFSKCADPKLVWLSKGCRDVRNVIGYSGLLEPTEKNILVMLTGFEFERATRLVDIMNPDYVIVGKGDNSTPTDKNHIEIMKHMNKEYDKWMTSNKKLVNGTFSFSCNDVEKARDDIIAQVANSADANFIIVPLNTKISTIAAAIVAFTNPKIQVCYAVPEVYNTENYSDPSDNITIIELESILCMP